MTKYLAALIVVLIIASPCLLRAEENQAQQQLEDTNAKSETATSALSDDRAKGWSNETFDGTSPPAATPDADAIKPQPPTAAEPNAE